MLPIITTEKIRVKFLLKSPSRIYKTVLMGYTTSSGALLAAGFVIRGFDWLQFEDDFDIIAGLEGLVLWPGFFIREISNKIKGSP